MNVHTPTLTTAIIAAVVIVAVYHFVLKGS